jgi:hypothetical protein
LFCQLNAVSSSQVNHSKVWTYEYYSKTLDICQNDI